MKTKLNYCYYGSNNIRPNIDYNYVALCSCPQRHTHGGDTTGCRSVSSFYCETPVSWSGLTSDLDSHVIGEENHSMFVISGVVSQEEENLVKQFRKLYEKPPDKGIIAVLLLGMFIRKFKMPSIDDSFLELYDTPVGK